MKREEIRPLPFYLEQAAAKYPEKDVLVQRNRRVSYRELLRNVHRVAAYLSRANPSFAGERACLVMDNTPEYVIAMFGVLKAGGIVVPVGDRLGARGLNTILDDCTPSVVVVKHSVYEHIAEMLQETACIRTILLVEDEQGRADASGVVKDRRVLGLRQALDEEEAGVSPCSDVSAESIAMLIYTSGTTGSPKGVMLSHRNLVSNALSIIQYLELSPDDKVMVVLPFYYSYGNSLLTTHVIAGGSLVLQSNFLYPNAVLAKMEAERVTGFSGVPSTFAILLNNSSVRNYRFPHLRYLTQAGGAMSPRHARDLMETFPGKQIFIMYGQTEASARLSYLPPQDLVRKVGSIGIAIPDVRLTVRKEGGGIADPGEVGEIVAEGPNVMRGYWGLPQGTREVLRDDGLHTGDFARMDEDGYLYIVGRRTDMIKSGAHRISAKEIEEVILEMPAVHEVAVVGEPDEILGESIKAFVVLRPGVQCGKSEIQSYCKSNLPQYKIPRQVVFCGELPKTGSGKVRKHELGAKNREAGGR